MRIVAQQLVLPVLEQEINAARDQMLRGDVSADENRSAVGQDFIDVYKRQE